MEINRVFAIASAHTFTIKPIQKLLQKYIISPIGWVDPYSGFNSPAEYTNDLNPNRPTKYHLDAKDFVNVIPDNINGVLFDPPYSYRQVSEHYKIVGHKATALDTSYNFYSRVLNPLGQKLKSGGFAISFGWNSNGFGKKRGFEIIEILIIAHGLHHNDTIVTVERKI